MEVVVVFPCVPPTATVHLRRMISASISARFTMGTPRARAASTSALPFLIADEITTTPDCATFSALWPMLTGMPHSRRRSILAPSLASEPVTS